MLSLAPHPLLQVDVLRTDFPCPLEAMPSPPWLLALLRPAADAPLHASDAVRAVIRDLLRHAGYKPTGRGKPASEYLLKAAEEGLASINAAVDVCNAVSLHSGLPVSVVDLDVAHAPHHIAVAPAGAAYVFNASGQTIDLAGLLCLFDAAGPCANAVKDAQRTKTSAKTKRTLSVLWGSRDAADRVQAAGAWYRELLQRLGATVSEVPQEPAKPTSRS